MIALVQRPDKSLSASFHLDSSVLGGVLSGLLLMSCWENEGRWLTLEKLVKFVADRRSP